MSYFHLILNHFILVYKKCASWQKKYPFIELFKLFCWKTLFSQLSKYREFERGDLIYDLCLDNDSDNYLDMHRNFVKLGESLIRDCLQRHFLHDPMWFSIPSTYCTNYYNNVHMSNLWVFFFPLQLRVDL